MNITLPVNQRHDLFGERLRADNQLLRRRALGTLQINVGKMCNLACHHCHVEAGPRRKEIMTWETMENIVTWLDQHGKAAGVTTIDITGGAPEMNPHFKRFVEALTARGYHILDRCNLTILLEPGYEEMIAFFVKHKVELVASLPCYLEDNVDKQRGQGVYHESIDVLQKLNAAGYGLPGSPLRLDLVFNPVGYGLPPAQKQLEIDYKRELLARYNIHFHTLWSITNMPIKRFEHALRRDKKFDMYMDKLTSAHRRDNVENVMCRDLVSIGWQGSVYDCDFNQMLQMPLDGPAGEEHFVESAGRKLWEFTPEELINRDIRTASHCFGCTAGAGSSCTGALG
ncbi:MAG TPA: arsenosugar biosynthesis radical SAM protein ArsS [Tepidisphaeraceae bacterium]|nr:arsenosugar biosynthesis radical SAM protein ArsS [Tepidisphaeraceae bacterium]